MATFCTLLWLMGRGIDLSRCTEYTEQKIHEIREQEAKDQRGGKRTKQGYLPYKEEKIANRLVNACSSAAVADRLAEEWELLGPRIRMHFTDLANKGWRSGNVTKGLSRADAKLGGRIFRRECIYTEKAGRKEKRGEMYVTSPVEWRFVKTPADYSSWSSGRKKKFQQQLARERRERRGW